MREKLKKGTHPKTKLILADLDSADLFSVTHYFQRWKYIKKLDGIRNEKFEEIYPELALKYAQTNDGMMPITNEISNSSNNNLDLSDEEGNFGAAESL